MKQGRRSFAQCGNTHFCRTSADDVSRIDGDDSVHGMGGADRKSYPVAGNVDAVPNPIRDIAGVETLEDLGRALRHLRRREARQRGDAELTYRQLAAKTGWSYGAIGQYFSGKVLPSTERFDTLIRLLGATWAEQGALATARDRVEEHRRGTGEVPPPGRPDLAEVVASCTELAVAARADLVENLARLQRLVELVDDGPGAPPADPGYPPDGDGTGGRPPPPPGSLPRKLARSVKRTRSARLIRRSGTLPAGHDEPCEAAAPPGGGAVVDPSGAPTGAGGRDGAAPRGTQSTIASPSR